MYALARSILRNNLRQLLCIYEYTRAMLILSIISFQLLVVSWFTMNLHIHLPTFLSLPLVSFTVTGIAGY